MYSKNLEPPKPKPVVEDTAATATTAATTTSVTTVTQPGVEKSTDATTVAPPVKNVFDFSSLTANLTEKDETAGENSAAEETSSSTGALPNESEVIELLTAEFKETHKRLPTVDEVSVSFHLHVVYVLWNLVNSFSLGSPNQRPMIWFY